MKAQKVEKAERRKHPRIAKPIEGSWRGASGGMSCRVGDLSLGGCFVYGMSAPRIGEETWVTMTLHGRQPITMTGCVVQVDRGIGFSVQFHELTANELTVLEAFLDVLKNA